MVRTLLPELPSLVIDDVVNQRRVVRVVARTQVLPVACPLCYQPPERVHAYHRPQIAALPVAGRAVVVDVQIRRLRCVPTQCPRRTFREQMPELAGRGRGGPGN